MVQPVLSSSNRSQLAMRLEGVYPTNFGNPPTAGNGRFLNMTSESLDYTVTNEVSKTLRADGQVAGIVQVGATAQGGFGFEAQYREYDALIEAVLQSTWAPYGTDGVSIAPMDLTFAATSITAASAPTGADAFTTLRKGQWFRILPPAGASAAAKLYLARHPFRVSLTTAPTSTVIVLDAATPFDDTLIPSLTGALIGSSYCVNGQILRTFALEVGHHDIGQYRQYVGMAPSKMDLRLSSGAIVTGSFDFVGKGFNLLQATSMGTPTPSETFTPANATRGVWDVLEGGSSVTSTTYIKSAELTIDRRIRGQDAVGVFGNAGVAPGKLSVTGRMEVYFADASIYNKVLNGAASSFVLPVLDVDGNGYVYHIASTKYTSAKVAVGGEDQDNMLSVEFSAQVDPDAASPLFQKTLAIYRIGT